MATLNARQLYAVNRQAGFNPASAVIMTAIQLAESGGRSDALGDETLQDTTWGPSVGTSQVRSLKAQTGTGGVRDILKLRDPLANAIAAFNISAGGRDYSDWTAYTTSDPRRSYKGHLAEAQAAAASEGVTPVGLPGFPSIPNPLNMLPNPLADALPLVKRIMVEALFVSLGLGLVLMGTVSATRARARVTAITSAPGKLIGV